MSTKPAEKTLPQFPSERPHPEILFGRALAACVHPFAAWRRFSMVWKCLIVAAYLATGYVIVLGALVILHHPA